MIPTGFGSISPLACPGVAVGVMPEPRIALQAMGTFATLQNMGPTVEVLHSLVTDLTASPDTRDIPGMWAFRHAVDHLVLGRTTGMGALRRILCGDAGALTSLGVAGHVMATARSLLGPQLERLIMEADLNHRPALEHLGAGLASLEPFIAHITRSIQSVVGPELWEATKAAAGVVTGYGEH